MRTGGPYHSEALVCRIFTQLTIPINVRVSARAAPCGQLWTASDSRKQQCVDDSTLCCCLLLLLVPAGRRLQGAGCHKQLDLSNNPKNHKNHKKPFTNNCPEQTTAPPAWGWCRGEGRRWWRACGCPTTPRLPFARSLLHDDDSTLCVWLLPYLLTKSIRGGLVRAAGATGQRKAARTHQRTKKGGMGWARVHVRAERLKAAWLQSATGRG